MRPGKAARRGGARPAALVATLLLAMSLLAGRAAAQSPGVSRFEAGVGGQLTGPVPMGVVPANLTAPDGSSVVLFRTTNRQRAGLGAQAFITTALTRRLAAEVLASYGRADLQTRVDQDREGAAATSLGEQLRRLDLEGAALWSFAARAHRSWFVRVGGGWTVELAGPSRAASTGAVADVGLGVKYWWRLRTRGLFSRLGVRIEGHAAGRWHAVSLGARRFHLAPVASGGLIVGS